MNGAKMPEKISPEVKKLWIKIRSAWSFRQAAFSNTLTLLSPKESNLLYDVVKLTLFKNSIGAIIKEHPELREILKNDEDRACMYAIYDTLSWKLNRREDPPKDMKLEVNTKSRIGRTYKF
ncbi:Uncharacterised protein [Candidatus Bilamarchaeum dharawalense]|uniref:Uncharacterized protein n=1 Tax=Candidatus Bilamarchaeum dharawalense TaxID=2885759 RepID=A0A5E4LQW0_9ARCH|nr:Uncharacterised protein [Candidatus Bilamarchaeum dharawalense]